MKFYKKTGCLFLSCLVFSFLYTACDNKETDKEAISIVWEKEKAVGVLIRNELFESYTQDSIKELIEIRLKNNSIAILGDYTIKRDGIEFRPALSFMPGLVYDVWLSGKFLNEFIIPEAKDYVKPEIVNIYPLPDSLPENLLKFYVVFSKPMQEGSALEHISLIDENQDTLSAVFLDLQPELWNNERTMLTLWLDPGRIKRGLQPNILLGPPLGKGKKYQLLIKQDWQDENGYKLKEDFRKYFYTTERDSVSPDINKWKFEIPKSGSTANLLISFEEPLDPILSGNTMQVIDANQSVFQGKFEVSRDGKQITFIPVKNWEKGIYRLEVESRLEDMAGNNLNRLFDADLMQSKQEPKDVYNREFKID